MYDINIEHRTCQAYQRASRWLADSSLTPKIETILVESIVHQTTFIPGRQHKFVLTVTNVDQSQRLLTIWDITRQKKSSEWSWKDDGFRSRIAVNADAQSEATLAVSSHRPQGVVLLHVDDNGILHEIHTIDMNLYPVTLTGDIIALCDRHKEFRTLIYNWKTSARAYLEFVDDINPSWCDDVVFAPSTILVVHTTSINLFRMPPTLDGRTIAPIATHSFGITEGCSAPTPAPGDPFSILLRPDDPDPYDPYTLELYSLSSFPPILTSKTPIECINFVLGRRSTVIGVRNSENLCDKTSLIAAAFPGPLNPTSEVRVREILCHLGRICTSLDYDEDLGRIALMSTKSWDDPSSRLAIIHI